MNSRLSIPEWARRVVLARLARLQRELTRLQRRPDADSIHDTRVAGRRLRAALRHLEDYFRSGDAEHLREEVSRLASALGNIRDLDILMESLKIEARHPHSPFLILLASMARRRERALQRAVPAGNVLAARLSHWKERLKRGLVKRVQEEEPKLDEHFAKIYPKLVARYFKRGHKLLRKQATPEDLHRFRIRTKRMRYITELYEEFDRKLKGSLHVLRGIQGLLGDLQDQSMIIAYFERRLMHVRTPQRQTEYMRVLHKARMRQSFFRTAFLRRWAHLKRIGVEKRWTTVSQEGVKPKGVKVTRKNKAGANYSCPDRQTK